MKTLKKENKRKATWLQIFHLAAMKLWRYIKNLIVSYIVGHCLFVCLCSTVEIFEGNPKKRCAYVCNLQTYIKSKCSMFQYFLINFPTIRTFSRQPIMFSFLGVWRISQHALGSQSITGPIHTYRLLPIVSKTYRKMFFLMMSHICFIQKPHTLWFQVTEHTHTHTHPVSIHTENI